MEKGKAKAYGRIIKIVVTGPESTGKSTLARELAEHYRTVFIPEYARTYIEELNRPYQYSDVEHIALRQVEEVAIYLPKANNILFLDTHLVITKVWFDIVYNNCPEWICNKLKTKEIDLYLLCSPDLPWIADNVRENGGEMREKLFAIYKSELEKFGLHYKIIEGVGSLRMENAIREIDLFLRNG